VIVVNLQRSSNRGILPIVGSILFVVGAGVAIFVILQALVFDDSDDSAEQTRNEGNQPDTGDARDVEDEEDEPAGDDAVEEEVENAPIERIVIEAADIDNSSVITLGLQEDGTTFEVPTNATQIAVYDFSGLPGEGDKAPILAAHVNYRGQDGAFEHLTDAEPGASVYLVMADGTVYEYRVVTNRDIAKQLLTWQDLGCDPTQCFEPDVITLITCGGNFNPRTRSYNDNVVVRAELVGEVEEAEIPS
jgi:LPXTG-site transpeptidase (sortase) family protein